MLEPDAGQLASPVLRGAPVSNDLRLLDRADLRLRWVFPRFRGGPQSGCHRHVSSPRRIERSVRVARTTLTCELLAMAYGLRQLR